MPSPGLVSFCDQEQHCTATETIARARVADPRLGARDGDSIGAVGPVARIRDAIPAPAAARRRQCEAHVTRPAVECHVYLGRGITELAAVDFPSDGVVVLIVPIVGIGSRAGGGDPLQLCQFRGDSRLYGLLLQWRDRRCSSPPVIIGVPAESISKARPVRAARRWSAA